MPKDRDSLRDAGAAGTCRLTPAVSRGDRAAMAAFYEAWFDRAYSMACSITRRDESFCLDVVQEAMLRVARRMPSLATDADVARWMTRVVHTAALDLLRKESRWAARGGESRIRERDAASVEQQEWVRARLAELPPEEAGLLRVRFWEGRTLEDAGEQTGMSGDAAHGRVRRVLGRLRALAKGWSDERA